MLNYHLAPSPVKNALVTLINGEIIIVTWSPSDIYTGAVHQHVIKRINSSGTFYYHASADQYHIVLPYYNDALLFVSAVNLFGLSDFEHAKTSGKPFLNCYIIHIMYIFVESCLPSPCINNGTCITVHGTDQIQCSCRDKYFGTFCEIINNVCMHLCIFVYNL